MLYQVSCLLIITCVLPLFFVNFSWKLQNCLLYCVYTSLAISLGCKLSKSIFIWFKQSFISILYCRCFHLPHCSEFCYCILSNDTCTASLEFVQKCISEQCNVFDDAFFYLLLLGLRGKNTQLVIFSMHRVISHNFYQRHYSHSLSKSTPVWV